MSEHRPVQILMVCLGNICRSPTAQGVMEKLVRDSGMTGRVQLDSAGTGDYHIGKAPDPRAREAALRRGYDLSRLRARQLEAEDFERFDYLLAMDRANLEDMLRLCPPEQQHKLDLLLNHSAQTEKEVPDPYFGGDEGFDHVLDLIEDACRGVLDELRSRAAGRA